MTNQVPSFYAIIPANVRYCSLIEPAAKLLYGEITALCNQEGYCWASDKYFANLYEVDPSTIQRWLISLKQLNFIVVDTNQQGFKKVRKIYISEGIKINSTNTQKCVFPIRKNESTDTRKNEAYNITETNTTKMKKDSDLPVDLPAESIKLAEELRDRQKASFPKLKEPKIEKWAKDIDMLHRLDNRSWLEIHEMIEWCCKDAFWCSQILSGANLRKHFDKMYVQSSGSKQLNEKQGLINKNRQFAIDLKDRYPEQMKDMTFDKKYVMNRKMGKEIPLDLPHETFVDALLNMFGGHR